MEKTSRSSSKLSSSEKQAYIYAGEERDIRRSAVGNDELLWGRRSAQHEKYSLTIYFDGDDEH